MPVDQRAAAGVARRATPAPRFKEKAPESRAGAGGNYPNLPLSKQSVSSDTVSDVHCETFKEQFQIKPELTEKNPNSLKVDMTECLLDSVIVEILYFGDKYDKVLVRTLGMRLYYSSNAGVSWSLTKSRNGAPAWFMQKGGQALPVTRVIGNPADKNVMALETVKGQIEKGDNKKTLQQGKTVYITPDAGATWNKVNIPEDEAAHVSTITWHPSRRSWALLSWFTGNCDPYDTTSENKEPCVKTLMLTRDFGKSFTSVQTHVLDFAWGSTTLGQDDRVYYSHHREKDVEHGKVLTWSETIDFGCVDLADSDSGPPVYTGLVEGGNLFTIQKNFLIVTKVVNERTQATTLVVSTDGYNLKHSVIPGMGGVKAPWFQILDAQDDIVIIHVESVKNYGSQDEVVNSEGSIYISDSGGYLFTFSLDNNFRSENGVSAFEKILSMDGVYLANLVMASDAEDKGSASSILGRLRTAITYDKGGVWNYLKHPAVDSKGKKYNCDGYPAEECSLHLHVTSPDDNNLSPVYSSKSSVGLMLGTGNVGRTLEFEPEKVNMYLSRDGGKTWYEVAKGAYIYEIGDHGGIIIAARNQQATAKILYSYDEGLTWNTMTLSTEMFIHQMVTEPNLSTTSFVIAGTTTQIVDGQPEALVVQVNFDNLLPPCTGEDKPDTDPDAVTDSNYELWSPGDPSSYPDSCMLGRHIVYTRRKREAACVHGKMFKRPIDVRSCPCKITDFACEAGYAMTEADGQFRCVLDEDHKLPVDFHTYHAPSMCRRAYTHSAYRKIPGDKCDGGWEPPMETMPCPTVGIPFFIKALVVLATMAILLVKVVKPGKKRPITRTDDSTIKGQEMSQFVEKRSGETIKHR